MVDIKIIDNRFGIKGTFDMGYAGLYENKDYSDEQIEIIHDVSEVLENWDIIKEKIDVSQASNEAIEKCLSDTGYPFWEREDIIIKDAMPKGCEDDFDEIIYASDVDEKIDALSQEFYDVPNDGSKEKSDVESTIRKMFPMFDLDKFLKGVIPTVVGLNDKAVSFQCNDSLNCSILCAAYDRLDEELTFTDWHNF